MHALRALFLSLVTLTLSTLTGLPSAQPTSSSTSPEANKIASNVMANSEWMKDLQLCPSQLVPPPEKIIPPSDNPCQSGNLGQCLTQCTAGKGSACYWLAVTLQRENAPQASFESLFQRSCKLGVVSGCTNHAAGILPDEDGDESLKVCATATFDAACKADDPWACTMSAMSLMRGTGVRQDLDAALKALEKSCKYGPEDSACTYGNRLRDAILAKRASDAATKH